MGALVRAAIGCAAARLACAFMDRAPADVRQRLLRTNYRGQPVSLAGGAAIAVATVAVTAADRRTSPAARRAAVIAGAAAAVAGFIDDVAGSAAQRGLRGHLSALRRGTVTTGAAKIGMIGLGGVFAGSQLVRSEPRAATGRADAAFRQLMAGSVIAASANAVNLLDLRPGRALKAALAVAVPLAGSGQPGASLAAVTGGSAAGMLPLDLGERVMLGDAGANCVGAVLGVAAAAGASRARLLAVFAALATLTLASEVVSFSKLIDGNAALHWIDQWGRRAGEAGDA